MAISPQEMPDLCSRLSSRAMRSPSSSASPAQQHGPVSGARAMLVLQRGVPSRSRQCLSWWCSTSADGTTAAGNLIHAGLPWKLGKTALLLPIAEDPSSRSHTFSCTQLAAA